MAIRGRIATPLYTTPSSRTDSRPTSKSERLCWSSSSKIIGTIGPESSSSRSSRSTSRYPSSTWPSKTRLTQTANLKSTSSYWASPRSICISSAANWLNFCCQNTYQSCLSCPCPNKTKCSSSKASFKPTWWATVWIKTNWRFSSGSTTNSLYGSRSWRPCLINWKYRTKGNKRRPRSFRMRIKLWTSGSKKYAGRITRKTLLTRPTKKASPNQLKTNNQAKHSIMHQARAKGRNMTAITNKGAWLMI